MLEDSICGWHPVYDIHGRGGLGYHQHSITGGMLKTAGGSQTITATTTAPKIQSLISSKKQNDEVEAIESEIEQLKKEEKEEEISVSDVEKHLEISQKKYNEYLFNIRKSTETTLEKILKTKNLDKQFETRTIELNRERKWTTTEMKATKKRLETLKLRREELQKEIYAFKDIENTEDYAHIINLRHQPKIEHLNTRHAGLKKNLKLIEDSNIDGNIISDDGEETNIITDTEIIPFLKKTNPTLLNTIIVARQLLHNNRSYDTKKNIAEIEHTHLFRYRNAIEAYKNYQSRRIIDAIEKIEANHDFEELQRMDKLIQNYQSKPKPIITPTVRREHVLSNIPQLHMTNPRDDTDITLHRPIEPAIRHQAYEDFETKHGVDIQTIDKGEIKGALLDATAQFSLPSALKTSIKAIVLDNPDNIEVLGNFNALFEQDLHFSKWGIDCSIDGDLLERCYTKNTIKRYFHNEDGFISFMLQLGKEYITKYERGKAPEWVISWVTNERPNEKGAEGDQALALQVLNHILETMGTGQTATMGQMLENNDALLIDAGMKGASTFSLDLSNRLFKFFCEVKYFPVTGNCIYKQILNNRVMMNENIYRVKKQLKNYQIRIQEANDIGDDDEEERITREYNSYIDMFSTDGVFDANKYCTLFINTCPYEGFPFMSNKLPQLNTPATIQHTLEMRDSMYDFECPNNHNNILIFSHTQKQNNRLVMNDNNKIIGIIVMTNSNEIDQSETKKLNKIFFPLGTEEYDLTLLNISENNANIWNYSTQEDLKNVSIALKRRIAINLDAGAHPDSVIISAEEQMMGNINLQPLSRDVPESYSDPNFLTQGGKETMAVHGLAKFKSLMANIIRTQPGTPDAIRAKEKLDEINNDIDLSKKSGKKPKGAFEEHQRLALLRHLEEYKPSSTLQTINIVPQTLKDTLDTRTRNAYEKAKAGAKKK
jgi:hypothetical protein